MVLKHVLLSQIIIDDDERKRNGSTTVVKSSSSPDKVNHQRILKNTPIIYDSNINQSIEELLPSDDANDINSRQRQQQLNFNPQHNNKLSPHTMIFVTGNNNHKQLVGGESIIHDFTCFLDCYFPFNLNDLIHIANGDNHSIFLTRDGKAFGIGSNTQGQLGYDIMLGEFTEIKIPESRIQMVQCGSFHSLLLTNDGSIWVSGDNSFHQLGIEVDNLRQFTRVEFPHSPTTCISHVSTSYSHTLCYSEKDNILYSMGTTFGDDTEYFIPHRLTFFDDKDFKLNCVSAGYRYSAFLTSNHTVYIMGKIEKYNVFEPTLLNLIEPALQIISGGKHLFLRTISNQFYGLGMNDDKQLPFCSSILSGTIEPQLLQIPSSSSANNNNEEHICDMAAGAYHTALTTSSGNIYMCGWSEVGQTGLGTAVSSGGGSNVDGTRLNLDPSISLDISRGTTNVKLFLSASADNSFIVLQRVVGHVSFFARLHHQIALNSLCDLSIIT